MNVRNRDKFKAAPNRINSGLSPNNKNMKGMGIFIITFILCLVFLSSASAMEGDMNTHVKEVVRESFGAGRWFPGDSNELSSMVNQYMNDAIIEKPHGRIVSAISPHAGYVYSGKVAGYTFRFIKESVKEGYRPETVVVLGLSHRGGFPGVALMDGDCIETPIGKVPLDKTSGEFLARLSKRIFFNYRPHMGEHSAENQIPFLLTAIPGVKAVIGLIGDHDSQTVTELVSSLINLAKEKQIMVLASSDMLHDPDYAYVTKTDRHTLEEVRRMDYVTLSREWKMSKQVFCGIGPVLVAMEFAKQQGCRQGTVLYYRNSGDDHPESRGNWVVGYSAVVFTITDRGHSTEVQ